MQPAFEREPYADNLLTEIHESGHMGRQPWVVLADTIFYPEGGGQPSDRGWINQVPVVDVQRAEGRIRHFLESPLSPGRAQLKLDWSRRYDLMQQHTGQHVITALAADRFGWQTTAFHLGESASDIELDVGEISPSRLQDLEDRVNREIGAARPIQARLVSAKEFENLEVRTRGLPKGHEGSIRLIEIEGLDLNTCGGTHLRSTAELGSIKLLRTESMRGGTRLYYVAGSRVLRRLADHESRAAALRSLLDTGDEALLETVTAKVDQLKRAAARLRQFERELADAAATGLADQDASFVEDHFKDVSMAFLQRLARSVLERAPGTVILLTATGADGEGLFVLATGAESRRQTGELGPRVAELLGGRGGGSGPIFQGKSRGLGGRKRAVEWLKRELLVGSRASEGPL